MTGNTSDVQMYLMYCLPDFYYTILIWWKQNTSAGKHW